MALSIPLIFGFTHPAHAVSILVVDSDGQASAADCNASDPAYTTVQSAVDAAGASDIVLICPGTYTEQVTVQKDLDLAGTSETGVVIKAPAALADSACVGSGQKVILD